MSTTQEQILESACRLYLSDGFEGFSMRKLAREVGVTAPALYKYYGSKEDVLAAVVAEGYRQFSQHLYRALEGRTPGERLAMAAQGYLQYSLEHSSFYEAMYTAPEMIGMERLPEEITQQGCAIGQFWADRVRECMDAGLLREGDAMAVSTTMWAHAHGLVTIYHRGLLPLSEEEFRTFFLESGRRMMVGMGTPEFGEVMDEARKEASERLRP